MKNETKQRTRRNFSHPLTREGTALRYNPDRGQVSRPMRAGLDICGVSFIRGADVETCRKVWQREQEALLAEGFEIVSTERY